MILREFYFRDRIKAQDSFGVESSRLEELGWTLVQKWSNDHTNYYRKGKKYCVLDWQETESGDAFEVTLADLSQSEIDDLRENEWGK